ncbi:DedA family protein [Terriglobus albidus]|uniref:DedA family protein n=1 Tax=Terriglobus albidus TaxID=1592106 RepID=A0A5B9EB32_9BACT|nr:VTT domain-containing protein [Terriglobus albidus]QEE28969.1 DedA family protein [Terriglobus albidus]
MLSLFHKWNVAIFAALAPLGLWGLGVLAAIDAASIYIPIDALIIEYSAHDHAKFLLYCLIAAAGEALGSLVPYYLGRAGGELFLMKKIDRARYERLRDRFERQEFLAIMIPSMMAPPMPVKLFLLAAGVFEMRAISLFCAVFAGMFLRFSVLATITILYGPRIVQIIGSTVKAHPVIVLATAGVLVMLIAIQVVRKLLDRTKGARFPVED